MYNNILAELDSAARDYSAARQNKASRELALERARERIDELLDQLRDALVGRD